ncbi:MAG TPA: DUF2782 domain-containing protein [Lysobacter sp.]|nr:DUF2782 domain-containing protein [Lysobacter sp.]
MRTAVSASLLLALALAIAAASGCATFAADPTADLQNPDVFTRTEANGDVITEYRVAGRLQVVKVAPARGPTYYLMDRDGDGRPDDGAPVSPVYWKLFEWN